MKLKEAAKNVSESEEETLTYIDFPSRYWLDIHTNNVIERLNREIRSKRQIFHRLAPILKPCENTPKIQSTWLESNRVG